MDFTSLDKNSSEQIYLQIRRVILRAIREQALPPGQRIPSVSELSELTNVSRMTVRQALQALVDEGWLYTVPGKGTFVSGSPRVEQNLQHLMGWTEEIAAQGMKPSTRFVGLEIIAADKTIAAHLETQPGVFVYRLVRVRLADNFPISVEKTHLISEDFPGLDVHIQKNSSLYQVLREEYQVYPVRALQFLEAGEADGFAAGLLEIAAGKPALLSERITYDANGRLIEFTLGVTKAGFLRYKTEMSAGGPTVRQVIVHKNHPRP